MDSVFYLSDGQRAVAVLAAKLLRENGLELHEARRAAAQQLHIHKRSDEPSLQAVLQEAQTQLRLFAPDWASTLQALRQLAAQWMGHLAAFSPLVRGGVWLGVATQNSSIYLDLYADSAKDVEIALLNAGVDYDTPDAGEDANAPLLRCYGRSSAWPRAVPIYLQVQASVKLRGALKTPLEPGSDLRLRGDAAALAASVTASFTASFTADLAAIMPR
jgi:hypothetical protein